MIQPLIISQCKEDFYRNNVIAKWTSLFIQYKKKGKEETARQNHRQPLYKLHYERAEQHTD